MVVLSLAVRVRQTSSDRFLPGLAGLRSGGVRSVCVCVCAGGELLGIILSLRHIIREEPKSQRSLKNVLNHLMKLLDLKEMVVVVGGGQLTD